MSVQGTPRNFFSKYAFVVEIDGFAYAGFMKCSELSAECAVTEHWEGGRVIPYKTRGRMTFPNITLERGATDDKDMLDWFTQVADAAANGGLVDEKYKRNLDIVQQDLDASPIKRNRVFNAFPRKIVAGEWDNTSDDVVITSVELAYDFWKVVPA